MNVNDIGGDLRGRRRCPGHPSGIARVAQVARRRLRDDSGSAIIELTWLGILLLVPLLYLVLALARLQAGSYAVAQASREAGRAFVTASDPAAAEPRAEAAAGIAFADQGFADDGRLEVTCSVPGCLGPEAQVTTTATVSVPLPLVPAFVREVVPLTVPISAAHVSPVPRFEDRG